MFTKLRQQESGFTIIELLIVVVIIGILALIGFGVIPGALAKSRDGQRQSDIEALHGQYQNYNHDNTFYPTYAVAADNANFNMDPQLLIDPNGNGLQNGAVPAAGSTDNQYYYQALPAGCDNLAAATYCTSFTLGVVLEDSGDQFLKNSVN